MCYFAVAVPSACAKIDLEISVQGYTLQVHFDIIAVALKMNLFLLSSPFMVRLADNCILLRFLRITESVVSCDRGRSAILLLWKRLVNFRQDHCGTADRPCAVLGSIRCGKHVPSPPTLAPS
jgi:hypothetical protein